MSGTYVIRSGPDRGARCTIVVPQERVPGVVNVGSQPVGVQLDDGRRMAVPRDWIRRVDGKAGRQVIRNVRKERAA